jgi:hypothetical protein
MSPNLNSRILVAHIGNSPRMTARWAAEVAWPGRYAIGNVVEGDPDSKSQIAENLYRRKDLV